MDPAKPSSLRTFYVAVGSQDQKLATLLELLAAIQLQVQPWLSTVVVCNSRDVLDAIVCALQDNPQYAAYALHSDLTDAERQFQVSQFQRHLQQPLDGGDEPRRHPGLPAASVSTHVDQPPRDEAGTSHQAAVTRSFVMVTTDVCLKALPKELQPIGVSLLIQYDLPKQKDQMNRRITSVLGSGRERRSNRHSIVIDFVVAGELPAFRAVEKFNLPLPILEMPVHVGEMFV